MLTEVITWVLNTYLGKYLEDFNPAQLSIALVSGEVELENVPIRRDALRSFGIPVEVVSGSIGKIKLQIPVRQFRTSPWSIAIDRVYGVFAPKDLNDWDAEKEKEAEYTYKIGILDAKEAAWRVENGCHSESYYSMSYSNWINYGASLATNILENLELKINDIHLRYEDTVNTNQVHHAAGIRIGSISAQSCDSKWTPGAKNSDLPKVSFKLLELKAFHFYWDRLSTTNSCKELSSKNLLDKMDTICNLENHNYLTNSINASIKFKRERCKQPLRNKHRPRIACEVSLDPVQITLNDMQYLEVMACVSGLQHINQIRSLKISRPTTSVFNSPKVWWQYAAKCHGLNNKNCEENWKIAKENVRYISLYKRLLNNPSENILKEDKQFKLEFEKERRLEELVFLRDLCYANVRSMNMNAGNHNVLQGRNILYHWFPNWLGWSKMSDTTTVDTKLEMDEAYKNIEDDILSALKETIENETFSKRDSVFGHFTFALSDVNIGLKSRVDDNDAIKLNMELKKLFCFVELKPKLTSYRVGISLGSIRLNDKLTKSTEFPFLIKPQKQEHTTLKTRYGEFLNLFSKRESSNINEDPWFQLQYERNPPDHESNYRLIMKSKSLDVVYNESALKWLISFFVIDNAEPKGIKCVLAERKRREVSRLKFFKNWKNVLVGQKQDNQNKWSFEIDISAPRIICVENFQERNSSVVLIDFGRFQLFKNERSSEELNSNDNDVNDKDSDDDLFMTPCSTPPGSQTSRTDSPETSIVVTSAPGQETLHSKFVINNDTGLETRLCKEIYDKYIINLTDLQILVCKNRECVFACAKTSSNYHLLDKFNINLHFERRIIDTSDPEYPAFTLFGNLNRIVAHINEQKISDCFRILNPITFDLFFSKKHEKVEKNLQDNYGNDSNTTIFKVVIGKIIIDIQSREKSIAEMQVIGAKAGITKKTGDVSINLSVHGFLLVDAVQSFGPDFELLIASHRHVEMDSISGSLKQSEPCSPTSPSTPDPNGRHRCASPHIINRALHKLEAGIGSEYNVGDALIMIDIHVIHTSGEMEPTQIANITFNNLDVIANQETIVEILGFAKRILDDFKLLRSDVVNEDHSPAINNEGQVPDRPMKSEISFDFHRLNILVLRSTRNESHNIGRKVGTLTMTEAKIHATLNKHICVSGALGGIQIIDVTPEGFNHQRIFSVGKDPLTDPPPLATNEMLYTLATEMYGNDIENDEYVYMNALNFKIENGENSAIVVKIRMASVWYTHCPRFIEEIYLCVKEFRQYFKNFVKSLRSTASHMAKGLVQHMSTSVDNIAPNNFGQISLDIVLSSPVLVLPKSSQSNEVLVANLGKITVCNKMYMPKKAVANTLSEILPHEHQKITYFIDVRNINLFSLNTYKRRVLGMKVFPRVSEIYSCEEDAVPILHDTALLFQFVYESRTECIGSTSNTSTLLIEGSVTQNLDVSLSRYQYEQLMESLNYATTIQFKRDTSSSTAVEEDIAQKVLQKNANKGYDFPAINTQFSVPILKLDLRNEHNISLVHLTLQEFSFKTLTVGTKQKDVHILLRTVVMEDLKCSYASKFRKMVNSDVSNPNYSCRKQMSNSCPNLCSNNNTNVCKSYDSIPSNLNKLMNYSAKMEDDAMKCFKDIKNVHHTTNECAENLVIYRSCIKNVGQNNETVTSSIDFNCLNLIVSIDKWFTVFDFFGLISSNTARDPEPAKQSVHNEKYTSSQELLVSVRSLNLTLVRNEAELAKANISNVQFHIERDVVLQSVDGRLGSISLHDLSSYGHLYQEKFSTSGLEALSFTYKRLKNDAMDTHKFNRSLEKDAQLVIHMSSVKYVHTKRFIIELHLFLKELFQLQSPVMTRIKSSNIDDRKNKNLSQKLGLEVHADSPIILLPVSFNSNHLLIADLGKFSLRNSFTFSNNLPKVVCDAQLYESTSNEIVDVMNIELLNINLMTGERESKYSVHTPLEDSSILFVGNFCIVKLGENIFKEKCHLNIQAIRNTESNVSHNIPDVRIKGTLSELNGLINLQQYKLIRGFLNHNLGEIIEDVYINYQANLNESLEILSSMTKVSTPPPSSTVWNTLSIHFILENVTIYLAELSKFELDDSVENLACIKFIKSNLEIDSFSDGSQDIDLISSEILLMDAREGPVDSPMTNVFKYILKPSTDASGTKSTVQAEIHSRSRGGLSKYTILLNNMRIMALLDFLERVNNFLKEEPFMSLTEKNFMATAKSNASSTFQHQMDLKTCSDEAKMKYEFVLNITNSEIVFVENSAQFDSNAIILKSTTVFSYKPNNTVAPISIDVNHLEIFSCILGSENDSSLSIIDPFTVNMELRNNCFQIFIQNQVFLRVSYNDVMLFSRMMQSIPKQTKKHEITQSHFNSDFERIAPLIAMGFQQNDCWLAMRINNNNLNEAALWLSQQKQKVPNSGVKITNVSFNANGVSICIIDDCLDADVPLLEVSLCRLKIDQSLDLSNEPYNSYCYDGKIETVISSNYYNRRLSGWEPIIESWECSGDWKYLKSNGGSLKTLHIQASSKQVLKFNVTSTLIELCEIVRKNWTEDYFVRSSISDNLTTRQRHPFVPFALKNLTGEPLLFKIFYSHAGGITRTEVNKQHVICNWISAQHNETVPFDFGPQSKWRHLDSHKLNMHQILVQIHGWTLIGPISIDKVGIYFRYAALDMEYSKRTRIVFEITLCGSAQKLITVRSALNAVNNTKEQFILHMKLRNEIENAVMVMKPLQKITIPLRYVDSMLFLKPYFENDSFNKIYDIVANDGDGSFKKYHLQQIDETGFCTRSLSWTNCSTMDFVHDVHSCFLPNKIPFYVISEVRKDKYPTRDFAALPGHTINILPPLKLKNLLCCDILYKITGHAEGRIDASQEIEIYSIDITESFSLNLSLDNYKLSGEIKIPMGHTGIVEPKFKLIDILNRELFLRVSIQSFHGKGIEIFIGAPIWIINKTGLPLIFRQEGTNQPASGQFDEHEHAREVSPLMFSFSDQEGSPLLQFRLGRGYGNNNPWCKSFGINKETIFRDLKAEKSKINYVVGVNIKRGKGVYFNTTFITLTPRFQLYNRTNIALEFAQKCDVIHEMTVAPQNLISALPGSKFPFHWPHCDQEPLLCVRVGDDDCNRWSSGLPVNEAKSLYINLRNEIGEMTFLRLEVILHGGTYILNFTDAHTLPPPIRIDNFSEVSIHFSQKGTDPIWRTNVKPLSSLAYVVDDPLGSQMIKIEAPGGNTIEYPLNNTDMAKSITYANFIYIGFKETFRATMSDCNSGSVSIEAQQLVLGVKDKKVIISTKCTGDRSQLWLMNTYGQLEHEGSSPPSEHLKMTHATPRLVLDVEKPPNPTEYTKLVVRPQNNQRVTTQTWRFEKGRLMCHANMCVQAADGLYGLKPGCDAVLGKIESSSRAVNNDNVPFEQSIEIQKLRPGSGHLDVVSKMDGPIQSIQVRDVKSNTDDVVLAPDPIWEHASVFNKVLSNKSKNTELDEVLVKLKLSKGLGLSIVSRTPCEEIAYLTFEDIVLAITLSPVMKALNLKVGDVQIDNQLLETICPITFYTTKSNHDSASSEALAINVKLLRSPNQNAVIFDHVEIKLKPCAVLLEERFVLKSALFLGYGKVKEQQHSERQMYRADDYEFSKSAKRYYFENLTIGPTQVRLTVLTAPKLNMELFEIKKALGLTLIKFEDALIEFDKFSDRHHFETLEIYMKSIKVHYVNQLKWHAAAILGSVDFLGNPLGFANDLSEGVSGLIFEGSVKSLVKNVTHGISNSTAKLTETISDSLGRVVLDEHDNETRQKILEVNYPTTGGHLTAGLKGFGFGLLGGVTSIVRHTYVGAQADGFPGFLSGLGKGIVGTVTKPLIGVLDLASEAASAVRETSRGTHHCLPARKRLPRCVTGAPGGLLPSFSYRQSKGQQYLYLINKRNFVEKLIFYEPNLCNDKEAKIRLLVSTEFVRIFSRCEEDPAIMIECHLSEVLSCHPLTTNANTSNATKVIPNYYIEISTNLPKVTRPRVRCQNEEIAERASRCINYAKTIFDEREHSLTNI
ncbi:vacuolar protein sorting 13D [Haematobia irritans]|uniref:vacuolar protein sorting 13D n=1 Tax=Haematobia irritans TaxID=7368 RepID=UPI003F504282